MFVFSCVYLHCPESWSSNYAEVESLNITKGKHGSGNLSPEILKLVLTV